MRRGHGSLYDIAVPGYKANLSDVLSSIALVQLDKVEQARRDPRAPRRDLRRGDRRPRRRRGGRARSARRAREPPLRRARHVRRPRRGAARADGREHRHVDPLPARASVDRVSRPARAEPAGAARHRSRRVPRCSRSRSRRRTPTTTSATRSLRCVACTRDSPDEARRCASRDAARHGARRRLHPRQDRPRQDGAHPRLGERAVGARSRRVLTLVTVPPMAWRWQRLLAARGIHERVQLADARVLRLLRVRAGAADVGRRRRVAHLRDGAAAPGADHADHRLGAARARARRRGDAAPRGRRLPARDRPLLDRRLPLARGDLRRRDDRRRHRLLLAQRPPPARVPACRSRGG